MNLSEVPRRDNLSDTASKCMAIPDTAIWKVESTIMWHKAQKTAEKKPKLRPKKEEKNKTKKT